MLWVKLGFCIGSVKKKKKSEIPALYNDCKWKYLQIELVNVSVVVNIFIISPVCKDHIICFEQYFLRLLGSRTNSPCIKLWALFEFIPLRVVLSCIMRDEKTSVRISTQSQNDWKRLHM